MRELTSAPIAQGRTAEIYIWDDRHVLKLYRDWCPPDWLENEARIARAIHEAGVPCPGVSETIEVRGRHGLIYERIEGISMLEDMNRRPWTIVRHARLLAEIQVQINQKTIPGLPSYKDRLRYDIRNTQHLDESLREKASAMLEALPDTENLCHGDYHPGNILLGKTGPIVIDWMTACSGSRWADVARTRLLLSVGPNAAGRLISPVIRTMIKLYYRIYIHRYHALVPETGDESSRWLPVIAAARLNEEILPEREALIKILNERLEI